MRLRLIAIVIVAATVLAGAWVGRQLVESGSGGGWSHEAGEAFDAERVLFSTFERGRPNLTLLVQARTGDVDGADVESAVAEFVDRLEQRPDVSQIESYWSLGRPDWMRSDDGTLALIQARIGGQTDTYADRADNLTALLRTVDDSVRITMGGETMVHRDIRAAMQGAIVPLILVALLTLALVFVALRNPVAVGLVATASLLAVALTLLGLYGLSRFREMQVAAVVLGVASAWGLATSSGFLMLSRYMAEREAGAGPREAVVATVSTAGRTVAIAATVAAATGITLWVLPTSLLRSTAYALGLAGLAAGISSIIVLGLLLAVVGVDVLPHEAAPARSTRLDPVTRFVQDHALLAGALLVVIVVPVLWLTLGVQLREPNAVSLDPDDTSRRVAQQISANFPSNDADAPFVVSPNVVDFSTSDELTADYARELSDIDGVARVDSDQGSFVAGASIVVPDAVTERHVGDQRTWLAVPVEGFGGSRSAEGVSEQITEVGAPFRVLIGGTAARQVATGDAVSARTPIFAGIVVLVVIALMAWLLRSVSAAIRGSIVIVLTTAAGTAVVQWGFADGGLRRFLGFSSDGSVAAVGPPVAWVVGVAIAAASSIYAWGAIRELLDRTKDGRSAATTALVATRNEHLVATALLILPLVPLVLNSWRTAQLIGAAAIATGLTMMLVGRFVGLPAATSAGAARLWPVNRDGEVRRVYPDTPATAALLERAAETEAAHAAELAEREAQRAAEEERARALAAELALLEEEGAETAGEPAEERVPDEPAVDGAVDGEVGPEERDAGLPTESAVPAKAQSTDVATDVAEPATEPEQVAEIEQAPAEAPPDTAVAAVETLGEAVEAGDEAEMDTEPLTLVAAGQAAVEEPAEVPATQAAAEPDAAADPDAGEEEAAAAEAAGVEAADVEVDETDLEEEEAEPATSARPAAGTVDVASLTESVIAAIEPATPFTTELNSAYVANPANNLSRVMEAILRDASTRGGEEVLVYGHASRDRYRWMVVDSGPEAAKDASRARTLAEAQRFIRRVGGVVECRPEGDFTVFVVEIPMAS